MEFFKGDDLEKKFFNAGQGPFDVDSSAKDDFFDDAYSCQLLGEMIWNTKRSPLANAIPLDVFKTSFKDLYNSFVNVGTFEAYLSVFRKIFGESVDVQFTVPAPGKLNIEINASGTSTFNFVVREIVDNAYVYSNLVTHDGDQILLESYIGFKTQYELEQMLYEMVPAGIFTQITLDIEGS